MNGPLYHGYTPPDRPKGYHVAMAMLNALAKLISNDALDHWMKTALPSAKDGGTWLDIARLAQEKLTQVLTDLAADPDPADEPHPLIAYPDPQLPGFVIDFYTGKSMPESEARKASYHLANSLADADVLSTSYHHQNCNCYACTHGQAAYRWQFHPNEY